MGSKWLCIDPGISGTGIAFFRGNELLDWGIYRSKAKFWEEKAKDIDLCLMTLFMRLRPKKVFVEWPSFQGLIAQNTGSIIKLAYLIGRICTSGNNVCLIPVSAWRGTVPKEVLWKRAEKIFGKKGFKSHAGDAVSLGHWIIKNNLA